MDLAEPRWKEQEGSEWIDDDNEFAAIKLVCDAFSVDYTHVPPLNQTIDSYHGTINRSPGTFISTTLHLILKLKGRWMPNTSNSQHNTFHLSEAAGEPNLSSIRKAMVGDNRTFEYKAIRIAQMAEAVGFEFFVLCRSDNLVRESSIKVRTL